jgi:hypothetical protein
MVGGAAALLVTCARKAYRQQCPTGQIGKVASLKRKSSPCSTQGWGTKNGVNPGN